MGEEGVVAEIKNKRFQLQTMKKKKKTVSKTPLQELAVTLTSLLTQTLKLTIRGSNLRWIQQTTGMTYVVTLFGGHVFCYFSDELWDSNEPNLGLSYICYNIEEKFNLMRELA